LDEIDTDAQNIGAVNTVVNTDGRLKGYNTDFLGVVIPLSRRTELRGKQAAVLGAGGAARAAVYGLLKAGMQVTILNRSTARGESLAADLRCNFRPLGAKGLIDFDIIVNATSVGMAPASAESPVPAACFRPGQVVLDVVYTPYHTRFLRDAAAKGAEVVHGIEMLVAQGAAQFELYTGFEAPLAEMEQALQDYFGIST